MMRYFAEVPDQQAVNAKPVFGDQPVFRVEVPAEHALELLLAHLRAVIVQHFVAPLRRVGPGRRGLGVARGGGAREELRRGLRRAGSTGVAGWGPGARRVRRRPRDKRGETRSAARLT